MKPIITATQLVKNYQDNRRDVCALQQVDFVLIEGETVGVVGLSGCGKSTLLRMMAGMERPDSGTVTYHGEVDVDIAAMKRRYHHIQMVFQEPSEAFSSRQTIRDFMAEPLRNFTNQTASEREHLVRHLMEEGELTVGMLDRLPHELSGGQLQRVVFLRALALDPRVVLLDEPTSALDIITQAGMLELFKRLRQQYGFASMFVSHDLGSVQSVSDRMVIMEYGKIVERIPADRISQSVHPFTRLLIDSILTEDSEYFELEEIPKILTYSASDGIQLVTDPVDIEHWQTNGIETEIELDPEHKVRAWVKS